MVNIPVLNKIDLPAADPERAIENIEDVYFKDFSLSTFLKQRLSRFRRFSLISCYKRSFYAKLKTTN